MPLNRDWIDWELADKINDLLKQHLNDRMDAPILGIGVCTLSAILVAQVVSQPAGEDRYAAAVMEIFEFMADLHNRGWDKPTKLQ